MVTKVPSVGVVAVGVAVVFSVVAVVSAVVAVVAVSVDAVPVVAVVGSGVIQAPHLRRCMLGMNSFGVRVDDK